MIENMFILAVIFTCLYMFKCALDSVEKQKKGGDEK